MSVSIRLASEHDVVELAALVAANLEFLAPWDPQRAPDFATEQVQRRLITDALGRHDRGEMVPLVIVVEGRIVGRVTVNDIIRGPFHSAHLGYWVSQSHNGQGIATAAVAATMELAFGEHGLHRLQAGTLPHNHGSQRVLKHNGFTLIGLAPRYLRIAGEWQDHLLFQRLAD